MGPVEVIIDYPERPREAALIEPNQNLFDAGLTVTDD
jgi:hypothetical protein